MKHKLAVNSLMFFWVCCVSRMAYASTFLQEVQIFDYPSLLAAAVGGLFGGLLKTIYTLATDSRAVFEILMEARKDLVLSFLAGGAAYIAMIMIESKWPGSVTREIRFGGVLVAGWTHSAIFVLAERFGRRRIDVEFERLRGAAPLDPPSSAAVPLSKD